MMETLCLRNEPKRYIVSIGNKVLIVAYDYFVAKRIEEEIVARKIIDETFSVVVGVRK